jgi:hypothetical protein
MNAGKTSDANANLEKYHKSKIVDEDHYTHQLMEIIWSKL